MRNSYIIGIAGGSASGKSTFAEILTEKLHRNMKLLQMDSYYKPVNELPVITTQNGKKYRDYNCPDSFDLQRLKDDIKLASNNFDIIIVEGLLALWEDEIRTLCDLRVFIDCPADIRIVRRIKRNITWGLSLDEIADVYLDLVRYRHNEYVEPSKAYADVIIDSSKGFDNALEEILILINSNIA